MDATTPQRQRATPAPEARDRGKQRTASFDAVKALAIFAVICIHTMPFRDRLPALGFAINDIARFAVPYFFVVSGYFFGRSYHAGTAIEPLCSRTVSRLLTLFVVGSALYLLEPSLAGVAGGDVLDQVWRRLAQAAQGDPLRLLLEGTKPQMWFLVSLAMALAICALFIRLGWERWLVWLALPLFEFGVLAGAYRHTPIGFDLGINTRNGAFFSLPFVVIGLWLARSGYRPSLRLALAAIIGGLALQSLEQIVLFQDYGVVPYGADYVHGTALYGTGVALLALARPRLGRGTALADWGRLSLGMYLIHYLGIDLLQGVASDPRSLGWQLLLPAAVFAFALAMSKLMADLPVLRRVVA
jgi:surface polysaccharide O-acyltransferase-like enzyme